MSSIKTGECDEICVEDVRDIISGDVAGSANKDRAEAQKDQSPCYYRGGCAGVEGCYCVAASRPGAATAADPGTARFVAQQGSGGAAGADGRDRRSRKSRCRPGAGLATATNRRRTQD